MVIYNGGRFEMKLEKVAIPEKVLGIDSNLLILFVPLIGVVLLAVISVNLVLLPKASEYGQMMAQIDTLKKQTKELDDKRTYLTSINQDELKKNSDYISNSLLPQKNSYVLVGVIRKIADKYNYQIDSFSISPGKLSKDDTTTAPKTAGVSKIPVNVSIIGPSDKYLDFINGMESSLPILALQSFGMQKMGEIAKLDLTVAAYYLDDNSKFDINKLTLNDLKLKKEESDLLARLNTFTVMDSAGIDSEFDTTKQYVKYERNDPFNL